MEISYETIRNLEIRIDTIEQILNQLIAELKAKPEQKK